MVAFTADYIRTEVVPRDHLGGVKHTELKASQECFAQMVVENALIQHSFIQGFSEYHEYLSTLQVGAVEHCVDRCREGIGMSFMLSLVVEIIDGVAVGQYDCVISPLAAKDVDEQSVACAARLSFVTVVGTHHFAHVAFLDQCLEGGEIGFPQVTHRYRSIVGVTQRFGPAVYGIVLGTSMSLEVTVVVALHSKHGLHSQYCVQVGVLSAGFLSSSPTRVAEYVDIRTPECEFGIAGVIGYSHWHIEYVMIGTVPIGSCLIGNG